MLTIKAPYNFVPVSDKVFFPEWADKISQDIPFEDGHSGVIELTITAETPIFVRNGHTKDEAKDKSGKYNLFNKQDDLFFIPSTSIKGSIRNVLEILSFSKMRLDKKAMFAFRDFRDTTYSEFVKSQQKIRCGWLKYDAKGLNYIIEDCGEPFRIGQMDISKKFDTKVLIDNFEDRSANKLKDEQKTASYKYKLLDKTNFNSNTVYRFSLSNSNNAFSTRRVIFDEYGEIFGKIVLTGQPNIWEYPRPHDRFGKGKYYEFVFKDPNGKSYEVSKQDFDHFKFIYSDSTEWRRMQKLLKTSGAPVFFRTTIDNDHIKDFGLSFMYKLPYKNSPFDLMAKDHKETSIDLSECIFGYTSKNSSLKGRVQFSNAFSENAKALTSKGIALSLGSPKASYYPTYIKQDGVNGESGITSEYKTYNNGKLSGWKRYPIRESVWENSTGNEKIDTIIYPVNQGSIFKSKIFFHNLKKSELGGLLSALTFHNAKDCYHQIGQGKPYGYGKVKIEARLCDDLAGLEVDCMAHFEEEISKKIKNWNLESSIKELILMARSSVGNIGEFQYMKMDNDRKKNEFLSAKVEKKYLRLFSNIIQKDCIPTSLCIELQRKKELEEQERQELAMKSEKEKNEKVLIEQKKQEESQRLANLKNKIEGGITFLDEKFENGNYKVNDFNGAKKRINDWMKKSGASMIRDDQHDVFAYSMTRIFLKLKERDKRNWYNFTDNTVWGEIRKWIGEEKAKGLFEKIINTK